MTSSSERKAASKTCCHAQKGTGRSCPQPIEPVILLDPFDDKRLVLPGRIYLCSVHRMELMERGVKSFVQKYPVKERRKKSAPWEQDEMWNTDGVREVPLSYIQPEFIESLIHLRTPEETLPDYSWREEFAHFKDAGFNLDQVDLTDKQLTAVCLVFFGGIQRKRAARAMKISSQALGVHIKAALKKIEQSLCQ